MLCTERFVENVLQAKPTTRTSDSDFRPPTSDLRPRTRTSDSAIGVRISALRLRVRSPVREGTRALEGSPPASFLQVERIQASPPSAQSIEHARHAIEQRLARLDVLRVDEAPRDRHPQGGARLGVRARRGREACNAMASLGVISLGRVQSDGTESASELFGEIPVVATDLSDHGSEDFDGLDDDVKDLKRGEGWFGLHALPSDRTVTAPRGKSTRAHGRWRGSFAPGVQAKPPDSDSDFRLGFRKSDFRPRTPTSDPDLGRGLPTRTGKTDSDLRLRTSALRLRVRLPVRAGTRLRRPAPPPAAERLRSGEIHGKTGSPGKEAAATQCRHRSRPLNILKSSRLPVFLPSLSP